MLLLLSRVLASASRRKAVIVLTATNAITILFLLFNRAELEKARLVYDHPQVIEKVRTVTVQGPTRVVTRIVKEPQKEIVEKIEYRDVYFTVDESGSESKPVPLSTAMVSPRSDRWLLGAALINASPKEGENWRALAGYSFRNRVDVVNGLGYDDGLEYQLQVLLRF